MTSRFVWHKSYRQSLGPTRLSVRLGLKLGTPSRVSFDRGTGLRVKIHLGRRSRLPGQSRLVRTMQRWLTSQRLLLVAMTAGILLLTSCRPYLTAQTSQSLPVTTASTAPALPALSGEWTTHQDRTGIALTQDGKPAGPIPVGEWYHFQADGHYDRVARFMTFAIGGVAVEEGQYEVRLTDTRSSGQLVNPDVSFDLVLFKRTESFFPDAGSPQQAKYRSATTDETLQGELRKAGAAFRLALRSGQDSEWRTWLPSLKTDS